MGKIVKLLCLDSFLHRDLSELKFVFLKGMWILEVDIDVWSCKYYSKNFDTIFLKWYLPILIG